MTLHARSDVSFTTTWRTHGANEHSVDELTEWMLVVSQVIPSTLIQHLAKNLDRRLSTVLFDLGHVQVIDENDDSLAKAGSEYTSAALFKLVVNDILDLVAVSLGREADLNELELDLVASIQLVHQHVLDVH